MAKMEKCEHCKGSGLAQTGMPVIACAYCRGRGEVDAPPFGMRLDYDAIPKLKNECRALQATVAELRGKLESAELMTEKAIEDADRLRADLAYWGPPARNGWKRGDHVLIPHDGFEGTLLNPYVTREGKEGWTVQLDDAAVVHVYGERWLVRSEPKPNVARIKLILETWRTRARDLNNWTVWPICKIRVPRPASASSDMSVKMDDTISYDILAYNRTEDGSGRVTVECEGVEVACLVEAGEG